MRTNYDPLDLMNPGKKVNLPLSMYWLEPKSRSLLIVIIITTIAIYVGLQLIHAKDIKRSDMPMNTSRDSCALGPSDEIDILIHLSHISREAMALAYAFKANRDVNNNMDEHYIFLKKMRNQFMGIHEEMLPKLTIKIAQFSTSNPNTPDRVFAEKCAVALDQLSLLVNILINESQYLISYHNDDALVGQSRLSMESVYKRLEILDKSVQALRKEIQGAVVAVGEDEVIADE